MLREDASAAILGAEMRLSQVRNAAVEGAVIKEERHAAPRGTVMGSERIGNVAREQAAVLADFMDDCFSEVLDDRLYGEDYRFICVLIEDLNHKAVGYGIDLVICSQNTDAWNKKLIRLLLSRNVNAIEL